MRKLVSLSIIASLAMSFSVYAESGSITPPNPNATSTVAPPTVTVTPTTTTVTTPTNTAPLPDMNAAANPSATLAPTNRVLGSALGEFKSVSCNTNPAFATNSCDQCFDGGSVKLGGTISGLFDNWVNNSTSIMVAYKEEQKLPNMVRFGNTTWSSNPADETKFWKYSSDVVWVQAGTGGKNQYILPAGQSVKFLDSELGAAYKLEKTDKKGGDVVGMLRFPLMTHVIDASANESTASTAYECATFTLSAAAAPATPVPEQKPTPKEITTTKTGPETLLLIVAAFFIAFGLMFSLRRRV